MKIGRNSVCPCGSGDKYKKCCLQRGIDYESMTFDEFVKHIPARGKNIAFLSVLLNLLELTENDLKGLSFVDYIKLIKSRINIRFVRDIHLSIIDIWPDGDDLNRCLNKISNSDSALYVGTYQYAHTTHLLNKYGLYENEIILIDPFIDPRTRRSEFNPIENPSEFIGVTFQCVLLWLELSPWILSGILQIIRDPSDFDFSMRTAAWEAAEARAGRSKELKKYLEEAGTPPELEAFFKENHMLLHPDEVLFEKFDNKEIDFAVFKSYMKRRREESPYYIEVKGTPQIMQTTTGVGYDVGKIICEKANCHIVTNLSYRWMELQVDRSENEIEVSTWSSFSKAFCGTNLKCLKGLDLKSILKLRDDGYLENMRTFLIRAWRDSRGEDEFDNKNIVELEAELLHHIKSAEKEWSEIDTNLMRWFGGESALGIGIAVVAGTATWLPAAAITGAGIINLLIAKKQRSEFIGYFPAGFFIDSIRNET